MSNSFEHRDPSIIQNIIVGSSKGKNCTFLLIVIIYCLSTQGQKLLWIWWCFHVNLYFINSQLHLYNIQKPEAITWRNAKYAVFSHVSYIYGIVVSFAQWLPCWEPLVNIEVPLMYSIRAFLLCVQNASASEEGRLASTGPWELAHNQSSACDNLIFLWEKEIPYWVTALPSQANHADCLT